MNRIYTLLLTCLLLMSGLPLWACSCISVKYFCESVGPGSHIAHGKVIGENSGGGGLWMNVEIWDWFTAGHLAPDTITIMGGSGADCILPLAHFDIGDEVVLAPQLYEPIFNIGFQPSHPLYVLYECIRPFLKVQNNKVIGPIRAGVSEQHIEIFKTELVGCVYESAKQFIRFYPNPVGAEYTILNPGGFVPDRIMFLNTLGQEVFLSIQPNDDYTSLRIHTAQLPAGVYFTILDFGFVRRTLKWVKL